MAKTRFSPPWNRWTENERWGVFNGWWVFTGDGLMHITIVVAGFVAKLGASNAVVGMLPAITQGGWLFPQLYIAAKARPLAYKLPLYRSAATVRTLSYIVMALCAAFLTPWPLLCLVVFLLAMTVNALASGVSGLPWLEVVSKTVVPERRPWFFATRNMYGGLLAFCSGLVVKYILASPLAFPYNYTLIFAMATFFFAIGYGLFSRVQEPPDEPLPEGNFLDEIRAIPETIAHPDLKAFLRMRVLLAMAGIADPFYAVYALRELHYPAVALGTFLMATALTGPLSNILWQKVAERKGSRTLLRYSVALGALAPLLALMAGHFGWPPLAFGVVFVVTSMAANGHALANTQHLLNIVPNEARSRSIGTINTLLGVALLTPILAGVLADRWGYLPIFWASAALFVVAFVSCGSLRRDA